MNPGMIVLMVLFRVIFKDAVKHTIVVELRVFVEYVGMNSAKIIKGGIIQVNVAIYNSVYGNITIGYIKITVYGGV